MCRAPVHRVSRSGVQGAHVYVTGRRRDQLDDAVSEIGSNVTGVRSDSASPRDLDLFVDAVRAGHGRVDVLYVSGPGAGRGVEPDRLPDRQAGTASGVFNASRQLGGALAVAVFGALLAGSAGFMAGLRTSLLIAGVIALAATAASLLLKPTTSRATPDGPKPWPPWPSPSRSSAATEPPDTPRTGQSR